MSTQTGTTKAETNKTVMFISRGSFVFALLFLIVDLVMVSVRMSKSASVKKKTTQQYLRTHKPIMIISIIFSGLNFFSTFAIESTNKAAKYFRIAHAFAVVFGIIDIVLVFHVPNSNALEIYSMISIIFMLLGTIGSSFVF